MFSQSIGANGQVLSGGSRFNGRLPNYKQDSIMVNQGRVTVPDNFRYRDMAGMASDTGPVPDTRPDTPIIWLTEDASEYANAKAANFFAGLGLIALYFGVVYGLYFAFFTIPA